MKWRRIWGAGTTEPCGRQTSGQWGMNPAQNCALRYNSSAVGVTQTESQTSLQSRGEGGVGEIHFNTLSGGDAKNLLDFVTRTSDIKYISMMKSEGGVFRGGRTVWAAKKVMSNKLIVRGDWIKGIVWAVRGGTLRAAARRFISALHRRLRSNLLVEDACKSFLSVRQTMELSPCCSSWITVLCVLARPYIGHWQKDLIEYPSTANLRAFRVGTFVNTSRSTIHTEEFFSPPPSFLFSLLQAADDHNGRRCALTRARARWCTLYHPAVQ